MTEHASATITPVQIDATHWQYSITLTDTGTTLLGTFWFAWVPGQDFLATSPIVVVDPTGWSDVITNGGPSDGFAIRWVASGLPTDLQPGDALGGFTFTSTDAPSSVLGDSVFFPATPVTTSFVYSGMPFSDAGFTFQAETACFLPGTLITTTQGEVPVEELSVGDTVVTVEGRTRPVRWIGHGSVLATRGRRNAATPVIVRKGALGDNVPNRDLHITKGHSLFIDGVLIPVEFLINHRSILWNDRAQEVTVYHIELDAHDVLLANRTPAESYRDDGNRWMFRNVNSGWGQPEKQPYAPVLTGGAAVDTIWQRLLDRAGPRPGLPLTDDADLHMVVDGIRLDAITRMNGYYAFRLPRMCDDARLVSRAAVPQEIGLARDPRSLGVAVRRILVRQGTRLQTLEANDSRLLDGFHAFEADNDFKWSNGDARLPAGIFADFVGPLEVVVQVAATIRYVDDASKSRTA
jgi:Hint domain